LSNPQEILLDLSSYFFVPPPNFFVVKNLDKPAEYIVPLRTVVVREDVLSSPDLPGILAHEFAHHLAAERNLKFSSIQSEEDFANAIEDWYVGGARTYACYSCNFQVPAVRGYSRCPRCGTENHFRLM